MQMWRHNKTRTLLEGAERQQSIRSLSDQAAKSLLRATPNKLGTVNPHGSCEHWWRMGLPHL